MQKITVGISKFWMHRSDTSLMIDCQNSGEERAGIDKTDYKD